MTRIGKWVPERGVYAHPARPGGVGVRIGQRRESIFPLGGLPPHPRCAGKEGWRGSKGEGGGGSSWGNARYPSFCSALGPIHNSVQKEILGSKRSPPLAPADCDRKLPVKGKSRGRSSNSWHLTLVAHDTSD